MTTTNVEDDASCASARHFRITSRNSDSNYGDDEQRESDDKAASARQHVASHSGDNDNNYGDDDNKCRR